MKCFVELDLHADIIDIPDPVALKIKKHRNRFLDWMYDRNNNHGYWVKGSNGKGSWFWGVQYDTEAFVQWLNKYVIKDACEKAVVIERNLDVNDYDGVMLRIFF